MAFFQEVDWEGWIKGLLAGCISGGANAVMLALTAPAIDPDLALGSPKALKLMGMIFVTSVLKDAMLYLRENPIPKVKTVTTVKTVEHQESPPLTVVTTVQETKVASVKEVAESAALPKV